MHARSLVPRLWTNAFCVSIGRVDAVSDVPRLFSKRNVVIAPSSPETPRATSAQRNTIEHAQKSWPRILVMTPSPWVHKFRGSLWRSGFEEKSRQRVVTVVVERVDLEWAPHVRHVGRSHHA